MRASGPPAAPAAPAATARARTMRSSALVLLPCALLPAAFALAAPTARGPILFAAMAGLAVAAIGRFVHLTRSGGRFLRADPSTELVLIGLPLLLAGFVLLPLAYLPLGSRLLWAIWAIQGAAMAAGLVAGLVRHDPDAMRRNHARRNRVAGSTIHVRQTPDPIYGMRARIGHRAFDLAMRAAFWIYAVLILAGMVLGGGAPLIVLQLLGPAVAAEDPLGLHVWAMTGLGFVVMPAAAHILPAIWRMWRADRAAAAEARRAGPVTYDWSGA